jgi:O-antigen/teichoic acid export membrane protein
VVSGVTVIVTFLLLPFTIHALGETRYGMWMLIMSMTGYLLLLTLGVPMATVRTMTQHTTAGKHKELNAAIGSAAAIYVMLGGFAFAIGLALFALFDTAYDVPLALRGESHVAFFLVVIYLPLSFIGQLPYAVLAAHQDFVRRNVILLSTLLLRLGLTVALLTIAPTLVSLAVTQMALLVFEFVAMWTIIKRRYPYVRLSFRDFDTKELRAIMSFSVFVLVISAGERMMLQSDALVIGAFLKVSDIPYYTVANSLGLYLTEFVLAIAAVVMPTATKLQAQGNHEKLEEVFLKWSKITLTLALMAGMFLILLGPRFLAWWIDPSFEKPSGAVLQVLMIGLMVYLSARGVALPVLMGLGKPKHATVAFVISGVANVALSIALVRPMGLVGVALGTAIPLIAFAIALMAIACRELSIPVARYARYVVPRALVGAMPAAVVLLAFTFGLNARGIVGLIMAGVAMAVVYALTTIFFVFKNDAYLDLRARLPALRAWRRA